MQTNLGLNKRRQLISDDITHVAVGSGDTAASVTDTALETEEDREAIEAITYGGTGVATVRTRFDNVLEADLTEVGAFDDLAGDMMDRIVHAVVDKNAGVELLVDITYEVSE